MSEAREEGRDEESMYSCASGAPAIDSLALRFSELRALRPRLPVVVSLLLLLLLLVLLVLLVLLLVLVLLVLVLVLVLVLLLIMTCPSLWLVSRGS